MPSKAETKYIKAEIRALKSALRHNAKNTQRECSKLRKTSVQALKELERKQASLTSFEADTNHRLAILEGRLNS